MIINGRFLCNKIDGISRFSLEICKQLKENNIHFSLIVPKYCNYENTDEFNIIYFGNNKSHLWEQIDLLRFLLKNNSPLLVSFSGIGPVFYNNKIITIHDLAFYKNKNWFSKKYYFLYSILTPLAAKNAQHIFTVSNFSKVEIVKYLKINERKITVLYNAVSFNTNTSINSSHLNFKLDKPFFLCVASLDPRKNIHRLINVFSNKDLSEYNLVIVGKGASHFNFKKTNTSENIIFTGYISDSDLIYLYSNCEFFIYPSLYEGFGIPPLEAMSMGAAVMVSNIPSLKEVCSECAIYFNPEDEVNILEVILNSIKNKPYTELLKKKGIEHSRLFSWNDSALTANKIINKYL